MTTTLKTILTLMFLISLPSYAAVVKLSKSGICHTTDSPWYQRTKQYSSFSDLQSCLDAGGRLPKGVSSSESSKTPQFASHDVTHSGYSRAKFGQGWADTDGDCQDSRAEALIETSTIPARTSGCRVLSGRWISPYSGEVILNASVIDLDHVVALKWAWDHGAHRWSTQRREAFANDPVNLQPVEAALNRAKGAKGPDDWLPPKGQCQYVARFKRITMKYALDLTTAEQAWIDQFLARC